MKTVLVGLVLSFCAVSAFATAQAFVAINEGLKSLNHNKPSQEVILGHRVTPQGQFVLVYK